MTLEVLIRCHPCKGSGRMGYTNGYVIFCETCWGNGLIWIERSYIGKLDDY